MTPQDLEVELELFYAFEPDLEVEIEVIDDLDDEWFAMGDEIHDDVPFEIDPVHPLRKLSAWVRGRVAA